ncbi:MAG: prepilin-type N-terminal cleavage/methylation domain-containing protein [Nibricoccus sp.]
MSPAIHKHPQRSRAAFTLVEVLVAMSISLMVMAGVMSTFLFTTRGNYTVFNYTDMESEARNCLDQFGVDVRMAQDISWDSVAPTDSTTRISLVIPTATGTKTCSYEYDPAAKTFSRITPGGTQILVHSVKPGSFVLNGFKVSIDPLTGEPNAVADPIDPSNRSQAATDCKQLQIILTTTREQRTLAVVTAKLISARFILRNKKVTI